MSEAETKGAKPMHIVKRLLEERPTYKLTLDAAEAYERLQRERDEAREALKIAAVRLRRLVLEFPIGEKRNAAKRWAEEAEALFGPTDKPNLFGLDASVQRNLVRFSSTLARLAEDD